MRLHCPPIMPALVLFGRRWEVGSDDFVLNSAVDLFVRLGWFVAATVIFLKNEQSLGSSSCEGGYFIKLCFYGLFAISQSIILIDACLIQNSRKGSIMGAKPRKLVPLFLYLRIFAELINIGGTILGIVWIFNEKFSCDATEEPIQYLYCLLVSNSVLFILEFFAIIYYFDPLGASKSQFLALAGHEEGLSNLNVNIPIPRTKNTRRWEKRFRRFYRCWFNCSSSEDTKNAFKEVGRMLGHQFAEELVGSDVIAGLLLLNMTAKSERQALRNIHVAEHDFSAVDTAIVTNEPLRDRNPGMPSPSPDDWLAPRFLHRFVKFPYAAMGWMCIPPQRLGHSFICCSCLPFRKYRYPQKVEGDNCCLCNASAIRDLTRVDFEDTAFVSFKNKVYVSPFFVAVDHKTASVVVSIRSTLSLHDLLTDLTGWPGQIPGFPASFKAHHGMLQASLNLKKKLDQLQIIHKLMAANPNYNLVIAGYSLGAGIGTILSFFLREEYPHLKCYAYSPPGALLTKEAADYCNDFVVSVIYGNDFVARLGLLQFERLKFRLIEALKNCKVPKYQILLRGIFRWYEMEIPSTYVGTVPPDLALDIGSTSGDTHDTFETKTSTGTAPNFDQNGDDTTAFTVSGRTRHKNSLPRLYPSRYPTLEEMYPPGKIFYVNYSSKRNRRLPTSEWAWDWRWAERTEFREIVVSSRMIWDHLTFQMPMSLRYFAKNEK